MNTGLFGRCAPSLHKFIEVFSSVLEIVVSDPYRDLQLLPVEI